MEHYQIWVVLLGCLILIFGAWREYGNSDSIDSLKSGNQLARKELENVRMSALTTKAENKRGHRIYILCFVLLYFLIIAIPDLVTVFFPPDNGEAAADGGVDVVVKSWFDTSRDESSTVSLLDSPVLPISLAIAMVLGVSSPTFGFIESIMRTIAYAIAGVPRNIFRVLQSLEELKYSDFVKDEELPLHDAFERTIEGKVDQLPPTMKDTIRYISEALRAIDVLQGPIIGPQRNVFRSVFTGEAPMERIDDLRARYNQLRGKIDNLDEAEFDDDTFEGMQSEAIELSNSMQCLFALYAIRSKAIPEVLKDTIQERIIKKVTENNTAQSINDVAIASVLGALFGALVVVFYARIASGASLSGADEGITNAAKLAARNLLFPLLPSVFLASITTIFMRHVKFDQGDWQLAAINQVPFWQYFKLALWPAIVGTISYVIVMCLNTEGIRYLALSGEFVELRQVGLQFLRDESYQFPRVLFLFFFFACGLLFIADHHSKLSWKFTVGLVATVLALLLYLVAIIFTILFDFRSPPHLTNGDITLMIVSPFAINLYLYAIATEFSDTKTVRRIFVSFGRRLKPKKQE